MKNNLTMTMNGEQTELQNEKWRELSAKLFKVPVGELSDYADWIDEFSNVELLQYCESEKFRRFLEFWDKPKYDRLMPLFSS